jgi:hypothetical protein
MRQHPWEKSVVSMRVGMYMLTSTFVINTVTKHDFEIVWDDCIENQWVQNVTNLIFAPFLIVSIQLWLKVRAVMSQGQIRAKRN